MNAQPDGDDVAPTEDPPPAESVRAGPSPSAPTATGIVPELSPLILRCPRCGKVVETGWRLCPYCAVSLEDPRQTYRLPPPWAGFEAIILLLALIGVLALFLFVL